MEPGEVVDRRFEIERVAGTGGMGTVFRARDRASGEPVALKVLQRGPSDGSVRFSREIRALQVLRHPAIVRYVADGRTETGESWLAMEWLEGESLQDRLERQGLTTHESVALARRVAEALGAAHAQGILHRDVKPSNIMLPGGDLERAKVLDFGVARMTDTRSTRTGVMIGTPGYMAPEQVRGEAARPPADVYALGSILFEILAGEPLHPRGAAALVSTLSSAQQSPARRAADREIAPELDAACHAALAEDLEARPSARELADRVQRYLDGDRDVEHRRAVAAEQLVLAHQALQSGDPEARATAINCAGRALALHPESVEAARLVTSLIIEPPRVLPAELVAGLAEEDRQVGTERLRVTVSALLALLSTALLLPLMQLRNALTLALGFGAIAAVTLIVWRGYRLGRPTPITSLLVGFVLVVGFTRVMGPFVLTPVVIAGSLLALTANSWLSTRPLAVGAWLLAVTAVPQLLEWTGVFAPTWSMVDGGVCARSAILTGTSDLDELELMAANLILLGMVAAYMLRINRSASDARHKVHVQAWHLGQLLPSGSAGASRSGPA